MTITVGWDTLILAVLVCVALVLFGAYTEYLIHTWKRRRH